MTVRTNRNDPEAGSAGCGARSFKALAVSALESVPSFGDLEHGRMRRLGRQRSLRRSRSCEALHRLGHQHHQNYHHHHHHPYYHSQRLVDALLLERAVVWACGWLRGPPAAPLREGDFVTLS